MLRSHFGSSNTLDNVISILYYYLFEELTGVTMYLYKTKRKENNYSLIIGLTMTRFIVYSIKTTR